MYVIHYYVLLIVPPFLKKNVAYCLSVSFSEVMKPFVLSASSK